MNITASILTAYGTGMSSSGSGGGITIYAGCVYVASVRDGAIYALPRAGTKITVVNMTSPRALAFDNFGTMWVVSNPSFVPTLSAFGVGCAVGQVIHPSLPPGGAASGIVVNSSGFVIISMTNTMGMLLSFKAPAIAPCLSQSPSPTATPSVTITNRASPTVSPSAAVVRPTPQPCDIYVADKGNGAIKVVPGGIGAPYSVDLLLVQLIACVSTPLMVMFLWQAV